MRVPLAAVGGGAQVGYTGIMHDIGIRPVPSLRLRSGGPSPAFSGLRVRAMLRLFGGRPWGFSTETMPTLGMRCWSLEVYPAATTPGRWLLLALSRVAYPLGAAAGLLLGLLLVPGATSGWGVFASLIAGVLLIAAPLSAAGRRLGAGVRRLSVWTRVRPDGTGEVQGNAALLFGCRAELRRMDAERLAPDEYRRRWEEVYRALPAAGAGRRRSA
ncbi:MAG: DUF6611 family protein [Pseudoclavibacter sp.]